MKKVNFTKLIIGIMLSNFFSFACAKASDSDNTINEAAPKPAPITVTIELKKGAKIKASIKQEPDLNFSTELDSEDKLPEFYAKFKDELEKNDDSKIIIDSDLPVAIKKNVNLLNDARKSGAKMYYLRSEGKIIGFDLKKKDDEISRTNSDKPDPLALIVSLSEDGKVKLNHEESVTINDLAPLENKLKDIFAARKQLETKLREETKHPLTRIIFLIPEELSVTDERINKVLESLKRAGAEPVLLELKQ